MRRALRQDAEAFIPLAEGPSPVWGPASISTDRVLLYVKNDGLLHPTYGGNKVRKLEHLLYWGKRKEARRLLSIGSAGSHQSLATALFAPKHGLGAAAVLCPQPHTEHAEQTLSRALSLGLDVAPAPSRAALPLTTLRFRKPGDLVILPGGGNLVGTLGYFRAFDEFVLQVQQSKMPRPDVIVVPLGSGGTAAGLLAGVVERGWNTRVVGVSVMLGKRQAHALTVTQAALGLRRLGLSADVSALSDRLLVDDGWLGPGYGYPSAAARHATGVAEQIGLSLDPIYTAKTFAKVLEILEFSPECRALLPSTRRPEPRSLCVLYWHTLSAPPLGANIRASGLENPTARALTTRLFFPSRG